MQKQQDSDFLFVGSREPYAVIAGPLQTQQFSKLQLNEEET
jgi:hypothetical protein